MVDELQVLQKNPMGDYMPFIILGILIVFAIYGIFLLLKSKETKSKSLKVGILIPLIIFILGIVWWIGDNLFDILDFGAYSIVAIIWGGIPLSILSIIFSAISLIKSENKTLPTLTIIYGIIYFIIFLIAVMNFSM